MIERVYTFELPLMWQDIGQIISEFKKTTKFESYSILMNSDDFNELIRQVPKDVTGTHFENWTDKPYIQQGFIIFTAKEKKE